MLAPSFPSPLWCGAGLPAPPEQLSRRLYSPCEAQPRVTQLYIIRYDCTPGGTEIRPPACTPPVTPPPGRNTTPGGTSIPPGAPPVDRIDQSSFQDALAPPIPDYFWPGDVPMSIPPSMFPAFMPNWSSVQGVAGIWPYGPLPVPPPPPPPTEVPQPGVRSEEPSRYVQLEDYSPEQGAVILGDWIVTITPIAGSLTASATGWFEGIMQQVQEFYAQWLCSDPVTRLTIRQQAIEAGSVTAAESRCALLYRKGSQTCSLNQSPSLSNQRSSQFGRLHL